MELRLLELDLPARRATLQLADARGVESFTVEGDGWARLEQAAAPLLAALESTIGGACHFELAKLTVEADPRRVRADERAFEGDAYVKLTRGGALVGELARTAISTLGRPRGDRSGSPSEAAFWSRAYGEKSQGWEMMRATPPLTRWFEAHSPKGKRTLVVGAGRGHDARMLDSVGAQVVAVDFAPEAVAEAKRLGTGRAIDFRERDLFTLASEPERYDLVVEHCCFCAIDPARRDEYVRVMHEVLGEGGELVGLFWAHGREGGPPFTTSRDELIERFSPCFTVEEMEVATDSTPLRAGQELLVRLRKRSI